MAGQSQRDGSPAERRPSSCRLAKKAPSHGPNEAVGVLSGSLTGVELLGIATTINGEINYVGRNLVGLVDGVKGSARAATTAARRQDDGPDREAQGEVLKDLCGERVVVPQIRR
eukprot:578122-Prymnesium_polylepis.1